MLLERALGDSQPVRNLALGEAFNLAQGEDLANLGRQGGDRLSQMLEFVPVRDPVLRRRFVGYGTQLVDV